MEQKIFQQALQLGLNLAIVLVYAILFAQCGTEVLVAACLIGDWVFKKKVGN